MLTLIVFISVPLNSEKASQVTPVIHGLELLYFMIPALSHCHYEYVIALVSCNLSSSCWSFSSHYSAVSFACFLSNGGLALHSFEFHLFFSIPLAKCVQKYLLSPSLQESTSFSCLAALSRTTYDIYCLSSLNEVVSMQTQNLLGEVLVVGPFLCPSSIWLKPLISLSI